MSPDLLTEEKSRFAYQRIEDAPATHRMLARLMADDVYAQMPYTQLAQAAGVAHGVVRAALTHTPFLDHVARLRAEVHVRRVELGLNTVNVLERAVEIIRLALDKQSEALSRGMTPEQAKEAIEVSLSVLKVIGDRAPNSGLGKVDRKEVRKHVEQVTASIGGREITQLRSRAQTVPLECPPPQPVLDAPSSQPELEVDF